MNRLVNIVRENFPIYAEQIIEIENLSFFSPWSLNVFKAELDKSVYHLRALMANKAVLGYICCWMFDSEIQVINFAVHPAERGQRLGQLIMTSMIETGISKGVKRLWLEVRPSNAAAKGLYTKLGFHEIGRRPRYYTETNEDAIVMALELSQKECDNTVKN
ncbi:ribosomal protein S18-alanine N-acetyltransferase [Thermodesulfobacteriota bacterium]